MGHRKRPGHTSAGRQVELWRALSSSHDKCAAFPKQCPKAGAPVRQEHPPLRVAGAVVLSAGLGHHLHIRISYATHPSLKWVPSAPASASVAWGYTVNLCSDQIMQSARTDVAEVADERDVV